MSTFNASPNYATLEQIVADQILKGGAPGDQSYSVFRSCSTAVRSVSPPVADLAGLLSAMTDARITKQVKSHVQSATVSLNAADFVVPINSSILEANRKTNELLRRYVEETKAKNLISDESARLALETWSKLQAATDGLLAVPNAAPGDDGQLMFAWDRGRHHAEIEFEPGVLPVFFYADRTDYASSWEAELGADVASQPKILKTLAMFKAHDRER